MIHIDRRDLTIEVAQKLRTPLCGKTVAVLGAGHSAVGTRTELARLKGQVACKLFDFCVGITRRKLTVVALTTSLPREVTSARHLPRRKSGRGATMAMHSTVGFGLSALGSWGIGVALDAAGGPSNPWA